MNDNPKPRIAPGYFTIVVMYVYLQPLALSRIRAPLLNDTISIAATPTRNLNVLYHRLSIIYATPQSNYARTQLRH